MSKVIYSIFLSLLIFSLGACAVLPSDTFIGRDARENRDMCLAWAHNIQGDTWKKPLNKIYAEDMKKDHDQKTTFAITYRTLKSCVAVLSPKPRPAEIEYANSASYQPMAKQLTIRDIADKFTQEPQPDQYATEIVALLHTIARIEAVYVGPEKKQFLRRSRGRIICDPNHASLADFVYQQDAKPSEKCLYVLQDPAYLKAAQATSGGILVTSNFEYSGKFFYLFNDNESENNVADGSQIAPGYFIYAGLFPYQSLTGPRRVYAFRRIDSPFTQDMLFYDGR